VADVSVDRETGEIKVTHLYGALDAGLAVNPAPIENQIEGMLTQAASRADRGSVLHVHQRDKPRLEEVSGAALWRSSAVTPIVVQRLDERSTGAGEKVMGAAVGAIANAMFDAIGVRLRQYPMTPERVRSALKT